MFYSGQVESFYNGEFKHSVVIVWAEDQRDVAGKVMNMFSQSTVTSIKIASIDLDRVKDVATKGGMVLAEWVSYG